MADQEVVIVDPQGTEHVFPAGFDPKRAAAIVRGQSEPPSTAVLRPSLSPVFESGQEPLIQRLQQLVSRISLANPERPQIVPELQPLGRLAELADRLMPFMVPTTQAAGAAIPGAAGAVGRAGKTVSGAALDVNPDLVGMLSPRLANALRVAQRARKTVGGSEETALPVTDPNALPPTVENPLDLTRRLRTEYRANQPATSPAESVSGGTQSAQDAAGYTVLSDAQGNIIGLQKNPTSRGGNVSGGTPPPVGPPPSAAPVSATPGAPLAPYEEAIARAQAATRGKSPQQLLNEEALARRRAAAQARQPEPAPSETAQKPALTAQETLTYLKLRSMGKSDQEAVAAIEAARQFQQRFELKTPTAAEKRFPKGNRGKSQPPRDDE